MKKLILICLVLSGCSNPDCPCIVKHIEINDDKKYTIFFEGEKLDFFRGSYTTTTPHQIGDTIK